MWKHGFEALATLDKDKDGKVSGGELSALALWFDENRDGVSQPGEVKPLTDPAVAVTALYYDNLVTNEKSKDVLASLGFERDENGKVVRGAALDWFTETGASKEELINKLITVSRIDSQASGKSDTQGLAATDVKSSAVTASALSGMWSWKTDDAKLEKFGEFKPGGYLGFRDHNDGTISGHSYVETGFAKGSSLNSQLDVISFKGSKERLGNGGTKISFNIIPEGKDSNTTSVSSTATLSEDGKVLRGESKVDLLYNGSPATFTYTWVAKRAM